jgi:hypothetical protein
MQICIKNKVVTVSFAITNCFSHLGKTQQNIDYYYSVNIFYVYITIYDE